ncbi:hypothetical protein BpHYR1_004062 [Brachionus plicatilis]|uniref:Uncharacterized protein n=1 Tax=Brachionus plicatilis TaxID=10195 RepID=A0A3M7QZ33_BRAPC|nr:hypothetical protein BpHYR1_004062 [Brachionus plicatilis]
MKFYWVQKNKKESYQSRVVQLKLNYSGKVEKGRVEEESKNKMRTNFTVIIIIKLGQASFFKETVYKEVAYGSTLRYTMRITEIEELIICNGLTAELRSN